MDARERFLIGGHWVPAAGAEFKTHNPASGEPLGIVAVADQADVDAAARAQWWMPRLHAAEGQQR
jgi:acyl-CoA reductase-like NAD-dependent aldehyde dehydrogenase